MEAAKNVFQTAPLVKESLLLSEILLWRIWLLLRFIRARTWKVDVKRHSQWTTEINIFQLICTRSENILVAQYQVLTAPGPVPCQTYRFILELNTTVRLLKCLLCTELAYSLHKCHLIKHREVQYSGNYTLPDINERGQ